uniref:Uncharacterized protein n=1 Tax=Oryza glaberrima TaxID=4538 RepID=I1R707_ORYGL
MVEARRSALQIRWHRGEAAFDDSVVKRATAWIGWRGQMSSAEGPWWWSPMARAGPRPMQTRRSPGGHDEETRERREELQRRRQLGRRHRIAQGIAAQAHNIVDSSATQQLGIASHSTSQHLAACLHGVSSPAANRQQPPFWSPGRNHTRQQLGKSARLAVQASS